MNEFVILIVEMKNEYRAIDALVQHRNLVQAQILLPLSALSSAQYLRFEFRLQQNTLSHLFFYDFIFEKYLELLDRNQLACLAIEVVSIVSKLPTNIALTLNQLGVETPCYIYDLSLLSSIAKRINAAYAPLAAQLYFFESANRDARILNILKDQNFGLTIVQEQGIDRALNFGFGLNRIEMSGFGLSPRLMRRVHELGISVNFGSSSEISAFAKLFPGSRLGARLDLTEAPLNKRGIPASELLRLLDSSDFELSGLHTYIETNQISTSVHLDAASRLVRLIDDMPKARRDQIEYINLGGGFGYDYLNGAEFDWNGHSSGLQKLTNALAEQLGRKLTIKIEVGRAAVVSSGHYVCSIVHAFEKLGQAYVVLDGNISQFPRPVRYGTRSDLHPFMEKGRHNFTVCDNRGVAISSGARSVAIVGNSHYSKDILGFASIDSFEPEKLLGGSAIGHDAGAYSQAMSDGWTDTPAAQTFYLQDGQLV